MNKAEVIKEIAQLSGVECADCEKVLDALEQVLGKELSRSGGIRNAFGKVYKLMEFLKK